MIKKYMENKLKRDITKEEWAKACKLNIAQLSMYRDMAHSARNKLVQHNIRLVDFWTIRLIEHSKNAKQISYYELLSEGIIGLRKAADLYDGSTRFIKYAKVFILSELYRGMTTLRPGMQLHHKDVMICYRAYRSQSKLRELLQRKPTIDEVAHDIGVQKKTLDKIFENLKTKSNIISMDTPLAKSGNSVETNLISYLDLFLKADQNSHFSIDRTLWHVELIQALECLTPLERRTLSLRYGLYDNNPRSLEDVAELIVMSTEMVRKILIKCFEKLRTDPIATSILQDGPPMSPITTMNGRVELTVY